MRRLFVSVFPLCLLLAACNSSTAKVSFLAPDGTKSDSITVEIVDTKEERTQGMMGRTELKDNEGMLFVFAEPQPLQFWMKDTLIPLEILFFDADGSFVSAATMQPCKADPCPTYKSAALAKYALEVKPGFRENRKIGVGWKMETGAVERVAKPE